MEDCQQKNLMPTLDLPRIQILEGSGSFQSRLCPDLVHPGFRPRIQPVGITGPEGRTYNSARGVIWVTSLAGSVQVSAQPLAAEGSV